ncbi:MAG: hypothetical protein HC780_17035 [Leptolyngbyaceae cyanobacterium CSU_1_3]|nr:hypothetical protein [Leptolyngbyaceae cyanobacterium CSU_1_3]
MNSYTTTLAPSRSEAFPPPEPILAISEQKKSGLILCKEFHAEFAGPGAAVGSLAEQNYQAVIAIGSPELLAVSTLEDRRRAYGRRIQWGRWLHKIVEHPDPSLRAERLLAGFEEFFGRQVVVSLPSEVLAMLAGVFPATIENVRFQHWQIGKLESPAYLPTSDQLKVTTITIDSALREVSEVPLLTTATISEIRSTYEFLRSA